MINIKGKKYPSNTRNIPVKKTEQIEQTKEQYNRRKLFLGA